MANSLPPPITDPLVNPPNPTLPKGQPDKGAWTMSEVWARYIQTLATSSTQASTRLQSVTLTQQAAAITTATLWPASTAGIYRVTWYARVTRAATSSSSLAVTIGWTDDGVALTSAGTALTGNTTSTFQSGQLAVNADRLTNITYAAAYSTSGATSMQYSLRLVVEALST